MERHGGMIGRFFNVDSGVILNEMTPESTVMETLSDIEPLTVADIDGEQIIVTGRKGSTYSVIRSAFFFSQPAKHHRKGAKVVYAVNPWEGLE